MGRYPFVFALVIPHFIKNQGGPTMYVLIIVIGMLSPASGSVVPVGVTSQVVGKFKSLEECKAAGSQPGAGGTISELNLSRGLYWYCTYSGRS